jgi:hypothetical protein
MTVGGSLDDASSFGRVEMPSWSGRLMSQKTRSKRRFCTAASPAAAQSATSHSKPARRSVS